MGLYDQFLSLTQHGLDTGTDIAMRQAAQPTLADVFMDRFRQGGQDRMTQAMDAKHTEEQAEAAKARALERQIKAMTGAAQYSTPESEASWVELQRGAGIQTPVVGAGLKDRQMDQALALLQERLDAQKAISERSDATKRFGIETTANKPSTALAKINQMLEAGKITPEQAEAERRKATYIAPQATYGAPVGALDAEGKPVLIQASKTGGARQVEGFTPAPKAGSGGGAGKQAFDAASNDVADLVKKIDEALAHPGLGSTIGATGMVKRRIPASDAAVASGLIDSIKSQSGLQRIAELKKSGAGLGSVTEAEHTLVQNAGNSLDLDKMDEKTLRSNLQELKRKAIRLGKSLQSNMPKPQAAAGSGRVGQKTTMADGTYSDGKTTVVVKGGKIVSEQ